MIIHVANTYVSRNQNENERMARAKRTWLGFDGACYRDHYGRSALDLGDLRDVPFVRDIIDSAGVLKPNDSDLVVLTNADSCLISDWKMYLNGQGWSHRLESFKIHKTLTGAMNKLRNEFHNGVDLVAVRWDWWQQNRLRIPDLLLGYVGWDWIYKYELGVGAKAEVPLVWHEAHGTPYWECHIDSVGCMYNQKLCVKWSETCGFDLSGWPTLAEYKRRLGI